MKHDIPRLRRNVCRAMRRGGKAVYVNLDDAIELLTVYTEREIERSLQGQPVPPIEERRPGKIVKFRARSGQEVIHDRCDHNAD
jgi:hypothetical protein